MYVLAIKVDFPWKLQMSFPLELTRRAVLAWIESINFLADRGISATCRESWQQIQEFRGTTDTVEFGWLG